MSETRPSWTSIVVGVVLIAAACGLVVLGAAFGPTQKYLTPSEAFDRDPGREVVVGGTVVDISDSNGHPIFVLADSAQTTRHMVRVEYVGPADVSFTKGSTAIFVGTVKRAGAVKARECVNHAAVTPLATTTQSASN